MRKSILGKMVLGTAGMLVVAGAASAQTAGDELFPPNAKPGECYARVFVPPTYQTQDVTVLTREASEKIEIIPARYENATEQVLVKEGYEKLEIIPAKYDWAEEKVLIKPAGKRLVEVPPTYEWVEEKVLVKEAHTTWKKGANPAQRVENGTGEIMCLVEVPATYKTVKKRVLKTPAHTKEVEIPAEYMTVRKRVVVRPEEVRRTQVPAEYKTVTVTKMATPPQEKRISIPEETATVTKRVKVSEGSMQWRAILCETNMKPGLITDLQRSLKNAGFNPGAVDGVLGSQTLEAVEAYQRSKGLATGGLTMETMTSLGVNL